MKTRQPKPAAARPRSGGGPRPAPQLRTPADAAADIDRVIELYCNEIIDKGPNDPEYWFWPRSAWVDPNQLIVDGENGSLYRVPFSTNAEQEVTFSTAIEVLETFTDLAPSAKARVLVAAAADRESPAPVRVFASRAEVPALANSAPAGGVPPIANDVGMNRDQLCEALGLPTTATDAEIDAATAARKAELAEPETPETPEAPETPEVPETPETPETADAPAPQASGPRPGMVEVPEETWADVQSGAAAGARVAEENERARRDDTIAAACRVGKISPSAKQSMENLHERDSTAFYNLLTASVDKGGLAPNLVPVTQRGGSGNDAASASAVVSDAEMAAMFPEVAIPAAGSRAG